MNDIPPHFDPDETLGETLVFFLEGHGVTAFLEGPYAIVPNVKARMGAGMAVIVSLPHFVNIQLDVTTFLDSGEIIVESFAGFGQDERTAGFDAFQRFCSNSFHVLLAAFLNCENEHAIKEKWEVGGREKITYYGGIGWRGAFHPDQLARAEWQWFPYLRERVCSHDLGPGIHWIRFFYAHRERKSIACEVLLDNQLWPELQDYMRQWAWPESEGYYSVRVFFVLVDPTEDKEQITSSD